MSERENKLLLILEKDMCTKEELSDLCLDMDVETENCYFLFLLADFGARHKWENFPYDVRKRLETIYKYTLIQNTIIYNKIENFLIELDKERIDAMASGEFLFNIHINTDHHYSLRQTEIVVREKDFKKAKELYIELRDEKSVLSDCNKVDIKLVSDKDVYPLKDTDDMWDRARVISFRSTKIHVPSREDALVMFIKREAIAFSNAEDINMKVYTINNLRMLLKGDKNDRT